MSFKIELVEKTKVIEDIIKSYLPKEEGLYHTVLQAMNYSFLSGGKRLRPMLMAETFHLYKGNNHDILYPFMAAIEMIHTYSLVHDDLPTMDNDEYRRGRLTTHMVYGEGMALLAGDALLNYAYETATKSFQKVKASDQAEELSQYKQIAKAMEILGVKAGIHGMIGGQVIDMESVSVPVTQSRLSQMYQLKTGGLIEASMMIGAILGGATEEEICKIEAIASDIGLAFQIKDDILDITSTMEVLGKPTHSDEKNDKTTYVTLMDINKAEEEVKVISNRAIKAYETLPYENDYLKALILQLIDREK